ncbi:MAG: ribbon-helix-helix domain-containing protein [Crocosphaera sp.]|nr:ribbon-helix-helix domain-containing protein [Crocosphaera sp.]
MIPSSHKQRISITVDAQLLESIDRLTDNRSQVVETALRLWYQQQIEEQLRQSYQQQTPQQQQFDDDWSEFAQTQLEEINSDSSSHHPHE